MIYNNISLYMGTTALYGIPKCTESSNEQVMNLTLTQKCLNEFSNLINILEKYNKFLRKLHRHIEWQDVSKYTDKYIIYDNILSELDKFKKNKLRFMNREFDKSIKYCDYGIEQCEVQEKLLLSIVQINSYTDNLNNIVNTINTEPIQKHICCINIDMMMIYSLMVVPQFTFNGIKYLETTYVKSIYNRHYKIHNNQHGTIFTINK